MLALTIVLEAGQLSRSCSTLCRDLVKFPIPSGRDRGHPGVRYPVPYPSQMKSKSRENIVTRARCRFMLMLLLSAFFCLPAFAAAAGFTGTYDFSTWTKTSTFGDAVVSSVDVTQQTLTILEPNNSAGGEAPQEYDVSHVVPASGTVSFDWSFDSTIDPCCSGFNFYVNGVLHNLIGGNFTSPSNFPATTGSGSFSIAVNAGDTITFGGFSEDGCCGASTNVITNFSAPTAAAIAVPTLSEWGMIMLSCLLALGAAFSLRRRRQ